jgi:hypothetical protein
LRTLSVCPLPPSPVPPPYARPVNGEPSPSLALCDPSLVHAVAGIMRDTKLNPSPVQLIWLFCESDLRLGDIPAPIHEVLCLATRAVGPLLGYQLRYDAYRVTA